MIDNWLVSLEERKKEQQPCDDEQTRARYPDEEGYVERDGVQRLLGGATATASRRSCCCRPGRSSTRGTGRRRSPTSRATAAWSRSTGAATAARTARATPAAYAEREFVADALAVLDATGTERAVLVGAVGGRAAGRCCSPPSTRSGSRASVFIAPARRRSPPAAPRARRLRRSTSRSTTDEGWAKYNRHYWLERLPRTSSSSSSRRCSPSRTRPSRSRTASAGGSRRRRRRSSRTTQAARLDDADELREPVRARSRCPVLVIHGDRGRDPAARRAARRWPS